MNLKINLVTKTRKQNKNKSLVINFFIFLFFLFVASFMVTVGVVWYQVYSLKKQISQVATESITVSSEIRTNTEVVNKYVLTKSILDYLSGIENGKFHYKRYLDEVVALMPPSVVLRGVDFQIKGWLSVTVFIPDLSSFKLFEERIADKTILDQTVFGSIFSEGVVRDKAGGYIIKLQFELKKNV